MIIQEVYIGKTTEVEDIFKEFCNLRHSYSSWKTRKNAKQIAKIEKMIEDFFGFSAFSLEILPDKAPNAMTMPVANSLDVDPGELIITTSKGYKFSKGARVAALSYITSGLFANEAFTDEEVFAAFLHELGHSFVHRSPMIEAQQDVYITMVIIQIIYEIFMGLITMNPVLVQRGISDTLASTNFFKLFMVKFNKAVKKIPVLRELDVLGSGIAGLISGVLNNAAHALLTITGIRSLFNHLNKWSWNKVDSKQVAITGHSNAYARSLERLSDDFATMYGYGPQLSTALIKMENPDNQGLYMRTVYKIPVIKKLFTKVDGMAVEMNGLLGAHPGTPDRILSTLEGMESDLKNDKDLPPKIKAELAANIREEKRIIAKIKSDEPGVLENRNTYIQALNVIGLETNTEDFMEKRFTDRKELKKFYDSRRMRKEQSAREELELELSLVDEMTNW